MMTPSAYEYLNSNPFALKRVRELEDYLSFLIEQHKERKITLERYRELSDSCHGLYTWWLRHLNTFK